MSGVPNSIEAALGVPAQGSSQSPDVSDLAASLALQANASASSGHHEQPPPPPGQQTLSQQPQQVQQISTQHSTSHPSTQQIHNESSAATAQVQQRPRTLPPADARSKLRLILATYGHPKVQALLSPYLARLDNGTCTEEEALGMIAQFTVAFQQQQAKKKDVKMTPTPTTGAHTTLSQVPSGHNSHQGATRHPNQMPIQSTAPLQPYSVSRNNAAAKRASPISNSNADAMRKKQKANPPGTPASRKNADEPQQATDINEIRDLTRGAGINLQAEADRFIEGGGSVQQDFDAVNGGSLVVDRQEAARDDYQHAFACIPRLEAKMIDIIKAKGVRVRGGESYLCMSEALRLLFLNMLEKVRALSRQREDSQRDTLPHVFTSDVKRVVRLYEKEQRVIAERNQEDNRARELDEARSLALKKKDDMNDEERERYEKLVLEQEERERAQLANKTALAALGSIGRKKTSKARATRATAATDTGAADAGAAKSKAPSLPPAMLKRCRELSLKLKSVGTLSAEETEYLRYARELNKKQQESSSAAATSTSASVTSTSSSSSSSSSRASSVLLAATPEKTEQRVTMQDMRHYIERNPVILSACPKLAIAVRCGTSFAKTTKVSARMRSRAKRGKR